MTDSFRKIQPRRVPHANDMYGCPPRTPTGLLAGSQAKISSSEDCPGSTFMRNHLSGQKRSGSGNTMGSLWLEYSDSAATV